MKISGEIQNSYYGSFREVTQPEVECHVYCIYPTYKRVSSLEQNWTSVDH